MTGAAVLSFFKQHTNNCNKHNNNKQTSSRIVCGHSSSVESYRQSCWILLPLFDRPCFALFWFNRKIIEQACRVALVVTDTIYQPLILLFALFDSIELFLPIEQVASYSTLNLDGSSIVPNESLRQIKLISSWAKKVTRTIPTHIHPMNQDFWQSTLILLLSLSQHKRHTLLELQSKIGQAHFDPKKINSIQKDNV